LTDVKDLFVADAWTQAASATRIAFARDGKIFMSVGSPTRHQIGTAEDAQDPMNHGGKILRLNDDGSVPADNPFIGRARYRPEIYALGIRNALALVIHPETGELWETENGPQGGDEINIIKAGRNYGWPVVSLGTAYSFDKTGFSGPTSEQPCAPGMEQPFLFWVPSIAPAGMTFYTGDKFPAWKGNILVAALRGMQMQRVVLTPQGVPLQYRYSVLTELKQRIREVRQSPDGYLYLLTDEDAGALLRIEPVTGDR
jgi:glucose/arabinose dehydrogenase